MCLRLPTALAQVKPANTSGSEKQYNEFNKVIKQNGYYIYKL